MVDDGVDDVDGDYLGDGDGDDLKITLDLTTSSNKEVLDD